MSVEVEVAGNDSDSSESSDELPWTWELAGADAGILRYR